MLRKEPAFIVMLLVLAINRGVDAVGLPIAVDPEWVEATAEIIVGLAGAWLIRRKVFSEQTIREAGLSPKAVEERAADPQIPTFEGAK